MPIPVEKPSSAPGRAARGITVEPDRIEVCHRRGTQEAVGGLLAPAEALANATSGSRRSSTEET